MTFHKIIMVILGRCKALVANSADKQLLGLYLTIGFIIKSTISAILSITS